MYNRYIPQPDGSHCRQRMQEPPPRSPVPREKERCAPTPTQEACPTEAQAPYPPVPPAPVVPRMPHQYHGRRPMPPDKRTNSPKPPSGGNISGFLKNLLPKDFDTGDLLIILLLILMAGDCPEDRSNALLTLALYMIL